MITAHVLVKNEERFVWYAVMSVISEVDKVLVWDMGSRDKTKEIIRRILNSAEGRKVAYRELNAGQGFDEPKFRQLMLDATETDWFLVVDGDEIWWQDSIKKVTEEIKDKGNKLESIVVPTINLVGDIFHYQEKAAGHYRLAGKVGHYGLRAINTKISGLHSAKPHGLWGWVDGQGKMIQDRDPEKIGFVDAPYLHATHLQRSGKVGLDQEVFKRAFKRKHELGIEFPKDYYYPEVFFRDRPDIVPFIWEPMSFDFWLRGVFETPFRKVKRRVLKIKEGY